MAKERRYLESDDDVAHYHTDIIGWVDRHGMYHGDGPNGERSARYSGATHRQCPACGTIHYKNSYCKSCQIKRQIDRYDTMPKKEWDGIAPLYSDRADQYFFSADELEEWCEETENYNKNALRLIICEPNYLPEIDGDDYFSDYLPEECSLYDADETLADLIEKVNKYIREEKPVLSYRPGKFAMKMEGDND